MTESTILRTAFDGTYNYHKNPWGYYLRRCRDPQADTEITDDMLKSFEIDPNAHKIPADIWTAWIRLCFHFVGKVPSKMEVEVRFLRSMENPGKFIAIVPKQSVTSASVRAPNFDECCNLLTGEEYTSYPPDGYIPMGSSHSHNTMQAFFSPEDNRSELTDPGIHLTVGEINLQTGNYKIAASIVGDKRRFIVSYHHLIDATTLDGITFHENVLKYVDYTSPSTYNYSRVSPVTNYNKWAKKYLPPSKTPSRKQTTFDNVEDFRDWYYDHIGNDGYQDDPFYWNDNPRFVESTVVPQAHNIKDLIIDYMEKNSNDIDALEELKDVLSETLIELTLVTES